MTSVSGPSAAATGQSITVNGTVLNRGQARTAGNVTVGFYVSADTSITGVDTLIGTVTVAPINAGASVPVSLTAALNTSLKAGSYFIGFQLGALAPGEVEEIPRKLLKQQLGTDVS